MVRIREGIAEAVVGVFLIGYITFSVAFLVFDLPQWIYKLWVALLLIALFLSLILYGIEQSFLKKIVETSEEMTVSVVKQPPKNPSPHANAKTFVTSFKIYPFLKDLPYLESGDKKLTDEYVIKALNSLPLGDIFATAFNESDPIPLAQTMERYKNLIDETMEENLPETIVSLFALSIMLLLSMRDLIYEAKKKARPPIGG
jgi:hypothetical protein